MKNKTNLNPRFSNKTKVKTNTITVEHIPVSCRMSAGLNFSTSHANLPRLDLVMWNWIESLYLWTN